MSISREDAVAFALSLPDTIVEPYYGSPAVKVASNNRAFLVGSHEADSFGLAIDLDTKEMLMETDPDSFWQTPHYVGYPMVLVKLSTPDPDRVKAIIERSRDWTAARPKAKVRKKK